jgi:hypothetical protein
MRRPRFRIFWLFVWVGAAALISAAFRSLGFTLGFLTVSVTAGSLGGFIVGRRGGKDGILEGLIAGAAVGGILGLCLAAWTSVDSPRPQNGYILLFWYDFGYGTILGGGFGFISSVGFWVAVWLASLIGRLREGHPPRTP